MHVEDLIRQLELEPHPEGGWYRETWRAGRVGTSRGTRSASTAIYFLLPGDAHSAWHRVASDEVWHHYCGAPLRLHLMDDAGTHHATLLGSELAQGQRPQATVPAGTWQAAEPDGGWALCGCTVAPGFDFVDFEMPDAGALRELLPNAGPILERLARQG